jgi:hypothetical protein
MKKFQVGILAEYAPYTPLTAQNLKKLADLKPKTLAIMHGSSFAGDCARALDDLNVMLRGVFGRQKLRRKSPAKVSLFGGLGGTAPESSAKQQVIRVTRPGSLGSPAVPLPSPTSGPARSESPADARRACPSA